MSPENPQANRQFRSAKARRLADFVREEIEQHRSGLEVTFKSNIELADMVGYPYKTSVPRVLKWAGLLEERAQIIQEMGELNLTHSKESAWMIGCLAGGGYIDRSEHPRLIIFSGDNQEYLDLIKSTGEKLFRVNGQDFPPEKEREGIIFYSSKLPPLLGDLREGQWANTLIEKHQWILENPEFKWALLTGLFDTKGAVKIALEGSFRTMVGFNTAYLNSTSLLAEVLASLGVQRPIIDPDRTQAEGVKRVGVYNLADAKLIAQHIHSHIPEKEEQLELIRGLQKAKKLPVKVFSEDELIREWIKLSQILSHPPTMTDIKNLSGTK